MGNEFFEFASPLYFWLFLLLPFIFAFEVRKNHAIRLPLSSSDIVSSSRKTWRVRFEFLPGLIKSAAIGLIIIALARPQIGNRNSEIESEGVDIVLALDTSGSMQALDLELNGKQADRMAVVKSVVEDFISGRQYDRIGMVVFGAEAYTQCPLTLDYAVLSGYLEMIDIGIAGDATAIGNALATSVKRLDHSEAKSKIVILLTDGSNTAGEVSPQAAAQVAKEKGIKVYTIAVGSRSKYVPFPVKTPFGMRIRDVELAVDEDTMKMIAEATGGRFFRADSTETLQKIYKTIDELEKTEVKIEEFTEYDELYLNYLVPAIVLLIAGWGLRHTCFLRVP